MTEREAKKIKEQIKKQSLGKWYVGEVMGKSEEAILVDTVMEIIDKHIQKRAKNININLFKL